MTPNPLVGTWRLMSFHTKASDGQINYLWGRDVTGFITYTAQGRVSVTITRADRPRAATEDMLALAVAEKAAAYDTCIAYAGTYEFQGDRVIHHVQVSLFPNWAGGDQVRLVELEGDRLSLSTPPMPVSGVMRTGHLVWERVAVE